MNSSHPIYESASIAYKAASYILGKPLWWALEQLSLVDSNRVESEAQLWMKLKGTYVVLDLVERAADIVSTKLRHKVISSSADALYSFDQFRREFGFHGAVLDGVKLSETDLRVLVKFLDRDKGVIVSDKDVSKQRHVRKCHLIYYIIRSSRYWIFRVWIHLKKYPPLIEAY